ncbi:Bcmad1 [Botrytis cinerea B05.10]|uniref:Spindle assembly checkpoint component MAD1 n=2 Tax=Botryotinia fuckeliana TaxID=40559 RepID=A0A384K5H1_BOTFB|nr:Bcmad1 [Botrytis cinerea B05.10]ATZ58075.1 Bcmad1 [Botrytis cinerea B05.10]CCD33927.1 similar to spindle assembly checkpoint component mad1 [Botrytis cinerea T4]
MRAHTPQGLGDSQRRRSSTSGGNRMSMGSAIPRAQSRMSIARPSNTQPSFDFLTGAESTHRPPSRTDRFRQSTRTVLDESRREPTHSETDQEAEKRRKELEELKAEVKTLKYTIDNHKQEEELAKLRHENELRDATRKAEEDFKNKQIAEGERNQAVRQYEAIVKEMNEIRDTSSNEKIALEKRVREMEESKRLLEEEIEDIKTESEEGSRILERRISELETRNQTLQRSVQDLQEDSDRREALLQDVQQQLADKDTAYGTLEAEVLRLKAQTGDTDTLEVIKRELSEQVTHIRNLEATNREQSAELKHYKRLHKSVEVVEEEKRTLQRKVEAMDDLQNELGEARIQRQRLEDERLAWTAYLQNQSNVEGQIEFNSPEDLARALVEERMQTATLVERLGAMESEVLDRDNIIDGLQNDKRSMGEEMEKIKAAAGSSTSGGDAKVRLRLERQRALAIKEVEYLRAQLKTFDAEDEAFGSGDNVDDAKIKRIEELENIVDEYRKEVQSLQNDLTTAESGQPNAATLAGTKHPREENDENERIGVLTRKNRKLQDTITNLQTSQKLLQKELSVTQERLTVATTHSQTRILSLRSNPTSDFEAIKLSTITALRAENADLLAQLTTNLPPDASVPLSTLQTQQDLVAESQAALKDEKTRNDRLKKVWGLKSQEFRDGVSSLLGWDAVFMPNGKMRVTSFYYPSVGEEENSIVFDGERGTMKVSGGPESKFAGRIMENIKFWVNERGSIPCFLAALTLEFYEEKKGDGTVMVG